MELHLFGKTENNAKIRLDLFEHLVDGINISQKHEFVFEQSRMWDKYRSKNMKWQFGSVGSISIPKHEMAFW